MRKLFEFIRSIYIVVLFVVVEIVAISYYARSSSYTQARLLTRSNQVAGGVHGAFAGMKSYFGLRRENRELLARVGELEERLATYDERAVGLHLGASCDTLFSPKYRTMAARIVSNTVNRAQNHIILNRGRRDGVREQMALLSPDGAMVGYVVDCSENYSVAISVLNTAFRASGRLGDTDYFGSIHWDGLDQSVVILDELSKYANPMPGQEVVTTGFSQYFPPEVKIGVVESAELNETRTAFCVRVRLTAEISRQRDVLLVENRDLNQIRTLEQSDKLQQQSLNR